MTFDLALDALTAVVLLGGCALATAGLVGLILKPDIFEQLHAAGLVSGPGVVLVLLAALGTRSPEIITSAILVAAFLLVTSSISTHLIAYAGARRYGAVATERGATGRRRPAAWDTVTGADVERERAAAADAGAAGAVVGRAPARPGTAGGLRVVVAYDGSPGADMATRLAAAVAWPAGTTVRLVWAAEPTEALDEEAATPQALAAAAGQIGRPGMEVETRVVRGDPGDVVVDETVSLGADLLITGSRRRGFVQSLLGLSAAGEIVDRAPCPVLVARVPELRSVLLTTDGSAQSAAAADLVARWPIFDLTPVHVVTVLPDAANGRSAGGRPGGRGPGGRPIAGSLPGTDAQAVDRAAALLMDAGRDVVTAVLRGRPGAQVVEAAARRSVDLIVIGSRGRTGLGRTLLGSVAGEVLASAACSVLIVAPPPRRPGARG